MTFYLRTTAAAAPGVPALARAAVQRADAALPVFRMTTMAATVARSLFAERMLALLAVLFGGLATLLAAVGLYGVMSYTVARRTREIGIRIALGASASEVMGMVLGEVAWLTRHRHRARAAGRLRPRTRRHHRSCSASRRSIRCRSPARRSCWPCVGLLAGYLPARKAVSHTPLLALRTE